MQETDREIYERIRTQIIYKYQDDFVLIKNKGSKELRQKELELLIPHFEVDQTKDYLNRSYLLQETNGLINEIKIVRVKNKFNTIKTHLIQATTFTDAMVKCLEHQILIEKRKLNNATKEFLNARRKH